MKIAILAHLKYPIAQPFAGGLEMHTHLLADSLIRRGHDVTLFAAEGSTRRLGLRAICPPTGTAVDNAAHERAIDTAEDVAYATMMTAVAEGGFDLVHNNSLHRRPLVAARTLGVPMVTVLHTPPFEALTNGLRPFNPGTAFVAVSDDLAGHWKDIVSDIAVIPNGIDLASFRPRARRPSRHAFWSGRIVPEKGLHLAIDAARAASLPLVFAGPKLDAPYWAGEVAPRLGPDLAYLGHLPHSALAKEVGRAAVAIVSPCWDEPFGLVVAEALGCGTPVAAFARGAIPTLIDSRCGALARPGDVRDLARAILAALSCDRATCRGHAVARFDGERMADAYETLYRRMQPQSRAAGPKVDRPAGRIAAAFA